MWPLNVSAQNQWEKCIEKPQTNFLKGTKYKVIVVNFEMTKQQMKIKARLVDV